MRGRIGFRGGGVGFGRRLGSGWDMLGVGLEHSMV